MFKDDLPDLLRYLGYPAVSREKVRAVADLATPYNEVDRDDALIFLSRYAKEQFAGFCAEFDACKCPDENRLPVSKLRDLMARFGFSPQLKTIEETLSMWASEMDAKLGVNGALRFIAAYFREEGFTQLEVGRLRNAFRCFEHRPPSVEAAPRRAQRRASVAAIKPPTPLPRGIPVGSIELALGLVLGPNADGRVDRVTARMHGGHGLSTSSTAHGSAKTAATAASETEPELVSFEEFLVIARLVRESEQEDYKQALRLHALPDGRLPKSALEVMMRSAGYETVQVVLDELVQDLSFSDKTFLDFNDVCHVIIEYNERNGLSSVELSELQRRFEECDAGGSGSVDFSQVGDIMRHMGYNIPHSDLLMLSDRVDVMRTGSLDFQGFVRIMGMHREQELKRYRGVFTDFQARDDGRILLPQHKIVDALESMLELVPDNIKAEVKAFCRPGVTWDSFVKLADRARRIGTQILRRNAGFKESEVQHFRDLFDGVDKDRHGDIDTYEIQGLMISLGIKVRTRKEQQAMMSRLDEAREAARAAGAGELVSADGGSRFGFWELVQLFRMLRSDSDKAADELVDKTAKELRFSAAELEQFRKIFLKWARIEASGGGQSMGSSASMASMDSIESPQQSPARRRRLNGAAMSPKASGEVLEDGLSTGTLDRLLRTMGMKLTVKQKGQLQEQASHFETTRQGLLSFVGFLRMMRWLIDSDFCGINDIAADAAQRNRDSAAAAASTASVGPTASLPPPLPSGHQLLA